MQTSKIYLESNSDCFDADVMPELALYGVIVEDPADITFGQFAIELSDAQGLDADAIYGVRFNGNIPFEWYMDH